MSHHRSEQRANRPGLVRTASVFVAGVTLTLLGACGGGSSDGSDMDVTLKGITFRPDTIEVSGGKTVTWSNEDSTAHTVTSGAVDQGAAGVTEKADGLFDSGEIAGGKTFRFTFDTPGTYPYFCALHPATMRGQITVR